ncbi:MAG: hypothetical protein QMB11_01435 [Nonlabens sp.]|jgi:hypothetical protein|uniref:hypothetical protein n=1 Tax=Nonlabens sp. TaxID=1888209 RepID=UPI0035A58A67
MKIVLFVAALITGSIPSAPIFKAKEDQKVPIGADFQSGANGIQGACDFGIA